METWREAFCHGDPSNDMAPEKMGIEGYHTLGRRDFGDAGRYQLLST